MNMLPQLEAPEHTENYEGFYHLISIEGTTETTELYYIIRDFDRDKFNDRKANLEQYVANLQEKYGEERINIEIEDQYYNMREKIEPVMEVVDIAAQAMKNQGITTIIEPIRGYRWFTTIFHGVTNAKHFYRGRKFPRKV